MKIRSPLFLFTLLFQMLVAAPSFAADTAADFTLRDINGKSVSLSDFKGRAVVVSFWATWCGPCKEEMVHLAEMYNAHEDDGLTVLSISIDDARSASRVKPYIKKMGYTFPVVLDRDSTVIAGYNPAKTLPYTVVLNRNFEVVQKTAGYNPGDEKKLAELVNTLLAEEVAAPAPQPVASEAGLL
jgi:peroxiredoxin